MDESTFNSKMVQAEVMCDIRPDYWEGYMRGLRRAYHGEVFGTEVEHTLWSLMATSDDMQRQELGRGYRDGLVAR